MQILEIKGTHMDLTPGIKQYVEDKLATVAKFCENFEPCDVQVEVGKTKPNQNKGKVFRAEFNMSIPGTKLRAESVTEDLYEAIDKSTDELKRQIKKYKEKLRAASRGQKDNMIEQDADLDVDYDEEE